MRRFGRSDSDCRKGSTVIGALVCALLIVASPARRRSAAAQQQRIDVQGYVIDATINPQAQTIYRHRAGHVHSRSTTSPTSRLS